MLARKYRLPATVNFYHTQLIRTPLFGIKYARNNLSVNRCAFVVRKTVDKRAVVRNRIRRVFRSCIEEHLENMSPGYDMLFFLEKGIIDKRHEELCGEIKEFFKKRQILV